MPEDQEEERKDIYLNFENTELSNFVNYMAELKKINLIPDKGLAGAKVSLTIRDPLTVKGAWNIFLTVLEMAGFSIIKVGKVHKVVPKDQKLKQPLPVYINVPFDTLPESDLNIRYVIFLQNLSVESVRDLLGSMLSATHSVVPQQDVNGFIITDKSYNIRSAIRILQELDQSGQPETVVVLRLKRSNATDVKELLQALIKKPEGSPLARLLGRGAEGAREYFPAGTKIIAEERTNSLVLLGAPGPIAKIEKFIVENIDKELKGAESPLHIYELQHTDAAQIAEILRTVTAAPQGGPGQQATKYGAIRGGVKYFKSMIFEVDKDGNRLIVSSTDKEDWKLLKKTIQDLDKPQPQVALETMIVLITASDLKRIGGMLRDKSRDNPGILGRHVDFQSTPLTGEPSLFPDNTNPISLLGDLLGQLAATQGAALLSIGKSGNIWAVFQAVKQISNASILSQPFITVANKAKASIEVGTTERVVQEEGDEGRRGFAEVDASTKLEVEPQINLDGIIRLQINVKIEAFTDPTVGNKESRKIDTNVTIADGQVLVLGGFVQTEVRETKAKTPLLSEIPIFGWFFKKQDREIRKQYVFIFMSPTIIKPRQQPGMQLYTKMKLHDATDQLEQSIITTKTRDPIFNWFFNPEKENYSHKVIDYANARYQPTTVDIQNDPYYRTQTKREMLAIQKEKVMVAEPSIPDQEGEEELEPPNMITKKKPRKKFIKPRMQKQQAATTTLQQLPQKAIMQPIKKKVRPLIADKSLEQKRKKLKEIILQTAIKRHPPEQEQPSTPLQQKRQQLKKFLAATDKTEQNDQSVQLKVDPAKRKSLKDFFAQHPTLHNQSKQANQQNQEGLA